MFGDTIALCGHCRDRVPARHEIRDGEVFLVKECPVCGRSETRISSDAAAWRRKRELWGYQAPAAGGCHLHCDVCRVDHEPRVVLVEMTNRCNMNCPVCIATVQSVGFDYHPPRAYFEKIFEALGRQNPKPFVEFYGGEPTLRADLIDLIRLARKYKLKVRVVTNGLKLADEEYCRSLCEINVSFRFGFDGRHPEIYRRLRGTTNVYEPKLRALANLNRYSRRKSAILCCLGLNVNDRHVGDLFDLCHEYRDTIDQIGFIPLKEDWHTGPTPADRQTTPEDAERAVKAAVPEGRTDFIPAGIVYCLNRTRSFFSEKTRSKNFMFAGSHPNCESMTFLVSDGQRYRSINHYLRIPLDRLAADIVARARGLDRRLCRLNPKKTLQRWYGRWLAARTFLPLFLRAVDFRAIFRGRPVSGIARVALAAILRRGAREVFRRVTGIPSFLRVGILPFEEYLSVDAQRLENCKGMFAYEDVADGQVKFIPVCTWFLYRKEILRTIAEKYGVAGTASESAKTPPVAAGHPAAGVPKTVV